MKPNLQFKTHRYCASKRTILWLITSIVLCGFINAQNGIVKGKVIDASGSALIGATIGISGTSAGTVTNVDGEFVLTDIPVGEQKLVASYIGYLEETISVTITEGITQTVEVKMIEDLQKLDEVVVIGYGTQKKKLTTGANLHVGNEEIEKMHSLRLEQALQGSTPGVQITANSGQPGENLKVRIRGVSTVGNSDPIYIVDGTPVRDISYLNPSDIESVDVLKDAASAAIYGTRGANGVLLITTKKGTSITPTISLDMYTGIQNSKTLNMLNSSEYALINKEKIDNSGKKESFFKQYNKAFYDSIAGVQNTDWMDHLFRKNAPVNSLTATYTGGSEKSTFSSSLSYFTQDGVIGNSGQSNYKRISARINSEHKAYKDFVKIGENLVYTHSVKRGVGVGNIYNSVVRDFASASPIFTAYDENRPDSIDNYGKSPWPDEANPIGALTYRNINRTKTDQVVGDVYIEFNLLKGLKFKTDYGIDFASKIENQFQPYYLLTSDVRNDNAWAMQNNERQYATNLENNLSYSTTLGKHNVSAMIGNTVHKYNRTYVFAKKYGLIFNDFDHAIIDNATIDSTAEMHGTKLDRAMLSYYGRLNYNYDEKYLVSLSIRRDGSSKFGPNNRWGNFPAISGGWVVTQENFGKINGIDFLKLRGSWGRNGNDQIPDYLYEALVSSQNKYYYFGSNEISYYGTSPNISPNPSLKWEQSEQVDLGFDMRFMKDFALTFDWYNKKTIDLLVNVPMPDITGVGNDPVTAGTKAYKNAGDVLNKGIEASLAYHKILGEFRFDVTVNFAYNKNEVTRIDNADGIILGDEDVLYNGCKDVYRVEEGYPIGFFYGYKANGIFQSDTQAIMYTHTDSLGKVTVIQPKAKAGDVIFVDLNHDGKISQDDRTMIGDPNPDYTYGISLNVEYKGFDFSIVGQGVHGNQIMRNIRLNKDYPNYTTEILDRWHGEGTSNTVPRVIPTNSDANKNYDQVSDQLYVYDGSFFKIRSINLGYDFSTSVLKGKIKKCRLYVSALNVFTFTKYPGLDPEVGYGDYNAERYENFSTGIDLGYYPTPATYMAGLQITF